MMMGAAGSQAWNIEPTMLATPSATSSRFVDTWYLRLAASDLAIASDSRIPTKVTEMAVLSTSPMILGSPMPWNAGKPSGSWPTTSTCPPPPPPHPPPPGGVAPGLGGGGGGRTLTPSP
eukprot:SAG25_NODE_3882_length_939_cov_0.750000_1_plen_118_part_10